MIGRHIALVPVWINKNECRTLDSVVTSDNSCFPRNICWSLTNSSFSSQAWNLPFGDLSSERLYTEDSQSRYYNLQLINRNNSIGAISGLSWRYSKTQVKDPTVFFWFHATNTYKRGLNGVSRRDDVSSRTRREHIMRCACAVHTQPWQKKRRSS